MCGGSWGQGKLGDVTAHDTTHLESPKNLNQPAASPAAAPAKTINRPALPSILINVCLSCLSCLPQNPPNPSTILVLLPFIHRRRSFTTATVQNAKMSIICVTLYARDAVRTRKTPRTKMQKLLPCLVFKRCAASLKSLYAGKTSSFSCMRAKWWGHRRGRVEKCNPWEAGRVEI